MGTSTHSIDEKRYGRLLARTVPRVITTELGSRPALTMVESLLEKGERNMTPEEDALLNLLTNLVRDCESRAFPPREKSQPHEIVAFLLEQRGLGAKGFWPVTGSRGRVWEILAGKRRISLDQAKKLAAFFCADAGLFI